ncbi:pentatricopeptide repeat-containing protein ELI1, chloroplastic [Rhodamnia argentea]|uniref:Pentatricopeptide repeat-containing protein ELI1, chloroplastic n=1 Tax=Rhodamnia argentea TaxID=178133 RepID=A0A8B8PDE5_9MYRT|nr:pentatricopeptide repeat-containing protein ELI1, chloroplastic [Rhodamnia argentea]XP_048128842.1 pentatricopeptide repeat-containing protein ELI1, chloroplastic [Rhodamnia argentea]
MSMSIVSAAPPPLPTTAKSASVVPPATTTANTTQPQRLAFLIDNSRSLDHLLQIHAALLRHGLHHHRILNFKLQRSYSSYGRLRSSVALFNCNSNPTVFNWTALIHDHAHLGVHQQALLYFVQMMGDGIEPNAFTFSSILKSCPLESGKALHCHAVKLGLCSDSYVRTGLVDVYARGGEIVSARRLFDSMPERSLVSLTAMITCYAKHGELKEARAVFDETLERDVVCWNVMIDGYAQHGKPNEALVLFRQMLGAGVRPNEVTVVSVLSACGQLGALELGRWIHSHIKSNGIQMNAYVGTALVVMYSKCGSLEDAILVFKSMNHKDVVAWNSMILGFAIHGSSQCALGTFSAMCRLGVNPNDITFIAILTACSHTGLIKEGWDFFNLMKDKYRIQPKIEHYGCMVNLLSRAGSLEEAYQLVKEMEIQPDAVIWGTLLGACRLHAKTALAEEIAEFLVGKDLANCGTYTLLSNIYAASGDWDGVAKVRTLMKSSGVIKEKGCSSIEVNNRVHEFVAGDKRHPKSREIYLMLEEINAWLKTYNYRAQTDTVLHDLGEEQKEQSLEVHSERLAIAFGLISTEAGTTIRIVKNLRVCSDCHAVTKLISLMTGRKIVMRDRNRFHHFVKGSCSCGDYW